MVIMTASGSTCTKRSIASEPTLELSAARLPKPLCCNNCLANACATGEVSNHLRRRRRLMRSSEGACMKNEGSFPSGRSESRWAARRAASGIGCTWTKSPRWTMMPRGLSDFRPSTKTSSGIPASSRATYAACSFARPAGRASQTDSRCRELFASAHCAAAYPR